MTPPNKMNALTLKLTKGRYKAESYYMFLHNISTLKGNMFNTDIHVRTFDKSSVEIANRLYESLSQHPAVVHGHIKLKMKRCHKNKRYVDHLGSICTAYSNFFQFTGELTEKGNQKIDILYKSFFCYVSYDEKTDTLQVDETFDIAIELCEILLKETENLDIKLEYALVKFVSEWPFEVDSEKAKKLNDLRVLLKLKFF